MKKTNKVLGMAAAVATGKDDAMAAWGLLGKREDVIAWAKSQEELAFVARERGDANLEAQHTAAARTARKLTA